jgi:phage terminase small subunit
VAKKLEKQPDLLNDASDDILLKHEAFIESYLECLNGTQAWQDVHPEADINTAAASASRLLRNVKIKAELERRFKERTMSKYEVLERLRSIANATLYPFVKVDDDGHIYFNFSDKEAKKHLYLVKKLKSKKQESFNEKSGEAREEKWIEVELHDALKAVELIGKYYALFTDKTETTEKKIIEVTFRDNDA